MHAAAIADDRCYKRDKQAGQDGWPQANDRRDWLEHRLGDKVCSASINLLASRGNQLVK